METRGWEERVFSFFLELHWFSSLLLNDSEASWALPSLFPTISSRICSLLLFSYSFPGSFPSPLSSHSSSSSSSFLQVTHIGGRRDLQDGRGRRLGKWKYSSSIVEHFQAQALGHDDGCPGKEAKDKIKNKKSNPYCKCEYISSDYLLVMMGVTVWKALCCHSHWQQKKIPQSQCHRLLSSVSSSGSNPKS